MYVAIPHILFPVGHRGIASSILELSRCTSSVKTAFTHTNVCDGSSGNFQITECNLLSPPCGDLWGPLAPRIMNNGQSL